MVAVCGFWGLGFENCVYFNAKNAKMDAKSAKIFLVPFRKSIRDACNSVLQPKASKVDYKSKIQVGCTEIGKTLRSIYWIVHVCRLTFNHKSSIHQYVNATAFAYLHPLISHMNWHLTFNFDAFCPQFINQRHLVCRLKKPNTQIPANLKCSINHNPA